MGAILVKRPPLALGSIQFTASVDHASVTSYEARVRVDGSSTVIASRNIGKPGLSRLNKATVDITALLNSLADGDYTVSVAAINVDGENDSDETTAFSLPLE